MTFRPIVLPFIAALALTSCGGGGPSEPTPTPRPQVIHVVGTFILKQEPFRSGLFTTPTPAPSCKGRGGYSDIAPGMEVVLSADGATLAVGRFSEGKVKSVTQYQEQCEFTFEFDVPEGHAFYNVKVGRRGDRNYTFGEITSGGALDFVIGP